MCVQLVGTYALIFLDKHIGIESLDYMVGIPLTL